MKKSVRQAIEGYLFISPWIIGFLFLTIGPMLASLYMSFTDYDLFNWPPNFVGLNNYIDIFAGDRGMPMQALKVTAPYAFFSVPIHQALALMAAILLNRKLKGITFFRTVWYLPAVMPSVAAALMWLVIFQPDYGLINGFLKLFQIRGPGWFSDTATALPTFIIISQWNLGAAMLIYLAGLQGVPDQLYEAASVDGAGTMSKFWHITIPMMTPTIFFNMILGIIGSWQVFNSAFIISNGGPANATLFYVLLLYRRGFQDFRMGFSSAMAWVLFFILMALVLLVFRSSSLWVYYEGEMKGGKK